MSKIILTALDDNDTFWFDHLVPFLLSLRKTDYSGEIGIISYGLSSIKEQLLIENGCLVFQAPRKYERIYIDRQWAAAEIAKKYDYVALYDTDIWFPHSQLSLFDEISDYQKLYCAYDVAYGDFIEKPAYNGQQIRALMQNFLHQHKKVWQVGVVAGHQQAWQAYQQYIENALLRSDLFSQEYGIDSLLMCLYSMEYDGVAVLPEYYNCTPAGGNLRYSNLSASGELLENSVFTVNNQPVQGLHITGPFRLWDRNFYEYSYHNGLDYFSQGKNYCLKKSPQQALDFSSLIHFCHQYLPQNRALVLKQILSDDAVHCSLDGTDLILTAGANTQILLCNTQSQEIELKFAILGRIDKSIPKGRFIAHNNKSPTIWTLNKWQTVYLKPNEEIVLASYDIDTNAGINWRLHNIKLVER
ncbi:hypothetical protein A6B43_08010 [Vespertiliibacter pulmonis]|uniref:Uncharacterized protein n=1 Tax=Vespertiliibacter pulmonis TaxID=1443036 RepID=A0A3N4VXB9_9PAST|nr:hypothetical protein [Vespertiliibacter pulmonis]QLB21469.1 hypothetical protein A6B43_08010 [Vespertiliibacter pulmonis]RPE85885.1 hypothetical protein EDC46_0270 [Vespertiliibacter pulmonis]